MNPTGYRSLYRFLKAVRRRLWLQAVLHWTWWGLLPTALWLSVTGLVHSLIHALPLSICLPVAVLPVGIALLVGSWQGRPSLERCVQVADRWFDGKALLTSTWDLCHHLQAANQNSIQIILQQTQQAIPDWHNRLHERKFQPLPKHAIIAISLSLTGIFLLLAPGAMPKYDIQISPDASPSHAFTGHRTGVGSRQETSVTLSSAAQPLTPAPPDKSAATEPTLLLIPKAATQALRTVPNSTLVRHPPVGGEKAGDTTPTETAGPNGESPADRANGSNEPGSGHATEVSGEPDHAPASAVQWVDLARPSSTQSQAAGTTTMELATAPTPLQHAVPVDLGTAQTAGIRYEAPFGPALRPYIARYFQILHEQQPGDNRPASIVR